MNRAPILIVADESADVSAAVYRRGTEITKTIAGRILGKPSVEGWDEIKRIEQEARKHGHPVRIERVRERQAADERWQELAAKPGKVVAVLNGEPQVLWPSEAPKARPNWIERKMLGFGGDLFRVTQNGRTRIVVLWSSGSVPNGWRGHFPVDATVERLTASEEREYYAQRAGK